MSKRRQKDLILAAEIGADRDGRLLRTRPAIKVDRLQRDLRRGLVELLNDKMQPLRVVERVGTTSGFLLGDLGDPRFPATLDDWRRELAKAQAGDTTSYFCRVDAGAYTIGSANNDPDANDDEMPQHIITFDAPFWTARLPITNAQWQAWVDREDDSASYLADSWISTARTGQLSP